MPQALARDIRPRSFETDAGFGYFSQMKWRRDCSASLSGPSGMPVRSRSSRVAMKAITMTPAM